MSRFCLLLVVIYVSFISSAYGKGKSCSSRNLYNPKWLEAEHEYLANKGFLDACAQMKFSKKKCFKNKIPRKDKKIRLSYGQIALLGDNYLKENLLFEEDGEGEISNEGMKKIFKCINRSGEVHEEQRRRPDVKYPDCQWVIFFNSQGMVETISHNTHHFGWYNMKAYVRIHQKSLNEAKLSGELRRRGFIRESDYYFRKALYTNGYADHLLSDAFSAGHIRIPRTQLKKWGRNNLRGLLRKYKGDVLATILHNTEAKDSSGSEIGFSVKNSVGNKWKTRSDSKLNECRQESHIGIRLPIEAIKASVIEVLRAYKTGKQPKGVFAATKLVPFSDEPSFKEKFDSLIQREGLRPLAKRLRKAAPVPLRWVITKRNVAHMLNNIEPIMSSFRADVGLNLGINSELEHRLPKKYIDAYLNVQ